MSGILLVITTSDNETNNKCILRFGERTVSLDPPSCKDRKMHVLLPKYEVKINAWMYLLQSES